MVYLFGNCNVKEIAQSFFLSKYKCTYKLIHSPDNYIQKKITFPFQLEKKLKSFGLLKYLEYCPLERQFNFFSKNEKPSLMIFMPSHEFRPLYKSIKGKEGTIWINRNLFQKNIRFDKWFYENFKEFHSNNTPYILRFVKLVQIARSYFPEVPIIILNRISNLSKYGPYPMSALIEWTHLRDNTGQLLKKYLKDIDNINFIHTDVVIENLRQIFPLEYLIPFLTFPRNKYKFNWKNIKDNSGNLFLRRDLDHLNSIVYDYIAKIISNFIQTGKIKYPDVYEFIERKAKLNLNNIIDFLQSEDKYIYANGLEYLIRKLPEDNSEIVLENIYNKFEDTKLLQMYEIYFSQFEKSKLYMNKIRNKYKRLLEDNKNNISFHQYWELKGKLHENKCSPNKFLSVYEKLQNIIDLNKNIVVYGANKFGIKVYNMLNKLKTNQSIMLSDDNANKTTLFLENIPDKKSFIIITAQTKKNIEKMVTKCRNNDFLNFVILKEDTTEFGMLYNFNFLHEYDYLNFFKCDKCGSQREYIDIDEYNIKISKCKKCADEFIINKRDLK